MAATVFVWDMFKYHAPDFSVGHASMSIHGRHGAIYISFWPARHSVFAAVSSPGKVHFINGDIKADGRPGWASKSLTNLDEPAIIKWWSHIQGNPFIDYKHPTAFQKSGVENAQPGNTYRIRDNQCATTVVNALIVGADWALRSKIYSWIKANHGSVPYVPGHPVPTVTPRDVRKLVEAVF